MCYNLPSFKNLHLGGDIGEIRQFRSTQFIVITHRRGTMEASDVLYGVTMQEQGISKLLRLDLNQMEQQLGIME